MIYIIDHQDSFTHNVVHQFKNFDEVVCTNFNEINENKLKKADIIVFSPGPGAPKDYPISSEISVASGVVIDSNATHEFNENYIKAKSLMDLYK